jgi:multidrug efflux pump subunit AcrB
MAGVVVNNGIVLIDCINQRRRQGAPATDAIVMGGRLRLRPVLLTAITTTVGLLPMAIGWSLDIHTWPPRIVAATETSAWWAPMAIAVIYGLLLATLLTLVQVPVMMSLVESLREWGQRRFGARVSGEERRNTAADETHDQGDSARR